MEKIDTKPKLVFFQYKYDRNLPEFLLMHKRDHVTCLAEFFDVTVINEDCDYERICDKYKPDLTLFEGGVNHRTCRRPEITNSDACPEIPKIGLHNADAWCDARAGFLSDMEHLGIETFFAISTTAAEHLPEVAESLYIWPNFIDSAIYRDYGEAKIVPVLLTGNRRSLYPWRQRVYNLIEEYYPSLVCPHRGYGVRPPVGQIMYGEGYARAINASWFVPTCGTVAKEVVRKHFEIPGCRACLVTEKSAGLEAAGFQDMNNCVFADEDDVLDKLNYLFQNPEELQRITDAGYQLVHSRHTLGQRSQIFQWFNLYKDLNADQKIVQTNPFEPLCVVGKLSGIKNCHVISNGLHLKLLRQGDEKLWAGRYTEAEGFYLKCVNYVQWMPEPKLRLALCNLYRGDAKRALSWIAAPIEYILGEYGAIDPDPVEWACYLTCLICLGRLREAGSNADRFPWLGHRELDRTRWVIKLLQNKGKGPRLEEENRRCRCSIHQLPSRSVDEWFERFCVMLKACGQYDLAKTATEGRRARTVSFREVQTGLSDGEDFHRPVQERSVLAFRRRGALSYFRGTQVNKKFLGKVRTGVSHLLHRLEKKWGYFLPYALSEMRNDEFFRVVQELAREEDIEVALVVGAASGEGSTEALLAGGKENGNNPKVFCINGATQRFVKLQRIFRNHPRVSCCRIALSSGECFAEKLEEAVKAIKEENKINFFDLVLIDVSALSDELVRSDRLYDELHGVRFVLLDDINSHLNYQLRVRLLRDPRYVLIAENAGLRNGYGVFKLNCAHRSGVDREGIEQARGERTFGDDTGNASRDLETVDV